MIKQVKDILSGMILSRIPDMAIVRSAKDEAQKIYERSFPFVALITNPGSFNDEDAKTVRYFDSVAGIYKDRYIRGTRTLPVLLRCWAKGEDAADELFSSLLPYIPTHFEYDDFRGDVTIKSEEHSDHTGNTQELYVSVAEIEFSVLVAQSPVAVVIANEIVIEKD